MSVCPMFICRLCCGVLKRHEMPYRLESPWRYYSCHAECVGKDIAAGAMKKAFVSAEAVFKAALAAQK